MKQDKELSEILKKLVNENLNLREMLLVIGIATSSVRRNQYCKKKKISYPEFLKLHKQCIEQVMLYPTFIICMEHVINKNKKMSKEYDEIVGKLLKIQEEFMKKQDELKKQNIKTKGADEMESFLKNLKKEGK